MRGAEVHPTSWRAVALTGLVLFASLMSALPQGGAEEGGVETVAGDLFVRITEAASLPRFDAVDPHGAAGPTLEAVAARQGIDPGLLPLLVPRDVTVSPGGHHVRFAATYDGIPVLGASAAVHYDTNDEPWLAYIDLPRTLPQTPHTAVADEARIRALALAAPAESGWDAADAEPWQGPVVVAEGPDALWHHVDGVLVAAHRASVLPLGASGPERSGWTVVTHPDQPRLDRATPQWFEASGTGRIIDPSPEVAAKDAGFADNPDGDETAAFAALAEVRPLQRLNESVGATYRLHGDWVRVDTDWDTNSTTATFEYPRDDARFEDTMSYFFMDYAQGEMQRLGFLDNTESQRVLGPDVGLFNAYWSFSDYIVFGYHADTPNGPADAAEDADVVVHEYGHAVQFDVIPVFDFENEDFGLIAEGWADLFSAMVLLPSNDGYDPACLGDWFGNYLDQDPTDATPYCFRRLDNAFTYTDVMDIGGHLGGQVLSGMAWNVTLGAGRDVALSLFLEANHLVPITGGDARHFAESVYHATDSLYGGAHKDLVAWSARTKVLDTQTIADHLGVPWVDVNGPRIDYVYPEVGYPGAAATIDGRKLVNNNSIAPVIHIGNTSVNASDWSFSGAWVDFSVPALPDGLYTLAVERDDGLLIPFEPGYLIDDAPRIFGLYPDPGVPGDEVHLLGGALVGDDADLPPAVAVGGVDVTVLEWDGEYVVFTLPEVPYGSHDIVLTRDDGKSGTFTGYRVVDPLVLDQIVPFNVGSGDAFTFEGAGFGDAPDGEPRGLRAFSWYMSGPGPFEMEFELAIAANGTRADTTVPADLLGQYANLFLWRDDGRSVFDERLRVNMPDLAVQLASGPEEPPYVFLPNSFGGTPDWVFNVTNLGTGDIKDVGVPIVVQVQIVQQSFPFGSYTRELTLNGGLAAGASVQVTADVFLTSNMNIPSGTWQGMVLAEDESWQDWYNENNRLDFTHTFQTVPDLPLG